jgi:Flp pilus assembly CpaF family ATPase
MFPDEREMRRVAEQLGAKPGDPIDEAAALVEAAEEADEKLPKRQTGPVQSRLSRQRPR